MSESLLHHTADLANAFLESVENRFVGARATAAELRATLDIAFPEQREAAEVVLDDLAGRADRAIVASTGPRFFGFVIGGALPAAIAADWMTVAWDQNAGLFVLSPLAAVIEEVTARWVLESTGLPAGCSVGFVTGAQMANFAALAAARHAVLRKAGWNVEEQGLIGAPPIRILAGGEAHVTIYTALRMLGLGTGIVETADADEQGRMRPEALRALLAGRSGPTIVCAQAGNVNTGAFDPLREIAAVTREHDGWLHVDGAFGLWAKASPEHAHLAGGIELADSWATDAHKWLNVPQDSGIVIVRDSAAHRAAMTADASYLQKADGAERDEVDWVPDFSRRARGFAVYAALRSLGREGLADLVARCCRHARRMAELLASDRRVEVLNEIVLNQALIRFHAPGRDADELTRAVIARIQQEGTCWLGGTQWQGKTAMRVSVSNWRTTDEDVDRSVEAILRCLDAEASSAA
ncbi:MAG TPA: pyridoxal-dependent decarboxylase [Thermoanaerobaculia bacterium]|nr:pyridoxal-dependent decarboxylase [Thermoanaerobaculia bacterium]